MQIKEKLFDLGLFIFGSTLTCAFILVTSNIQAAPHLEELASRFPAAGEVSRQVMALVRATSAFDFGPEADPSSDGRMCWELKGTDLDLIAVLDRAHFVEPEAQELYTDSASDLPSIVEAPEIDETIIPLDCRLEGAPTYVSFSTAAARLLCEAIGTSREFDSVNQSTLIAETH